MKMLQTALISFSVLGLIGCANERLKELERLYLQHRGYATIDAKFCMQTPSEYRQKLKYIFVMDKSGSNQAPPDASDPYGYKRYAPLSNFLQNAQDDPGYTYYSLINFSDTANLVQDFTDDRLAFDGVVNAEWNRLGPHQPSDAGFTNYIGALDRVYNLISTDVNAAKNSPTVVTSMYVVVFISDGYPFVQNSGSATGTVAQLYDPDIRNKISQLLGLQTDVNYKNYIDQVVLHTGYYFELRDSAAESLLATMAAQGGGDPYQFGAGVNIDYNLFAVPIRNVRFLLTDILVENASTVWWDDGRYLLDTDHDGMPDEIEFQMGSNLLDRDSDGNGVSDVVEFRVTGKPCKDAHCNRAVVARDNFAACTGMMPVTRPDGSPNPAPDGVNSSPWGTNYFGDRDHDGLNDCEEWLLRSGRDEFDSNKDHIPDYLSFKNQLPFIAGMNSSMGDPDSDAMKSYSEIKLGFPILFSNNKVMNFRPMIYDLKRADSVNGTDCYSLRVHDVATAGWDNLIRVYLVENPAVIDSKPILKVAERALQGKANSIIFSEGDFK